MAFSCSSTAHKTKTYRIDFGRFYESFYSSCRYTICSLFIYFHFLSTSTIFKFWIIKKTDPKLPPHLLFCSRTIHFGFVESISILCQNRIINDKKMKSQIQRWRLRKEITIEGFEIVKFDFIENRKDSFYNQIMIFCAKMVEFAFVSVLN